MFDDVRYRNSLRTNNGTLNLIRNFIKMTELDAEKPVEKQQGEASTGGRAGGGNNKGGGKKPRPDRRDKDRKPNKGSAGGEAPKKVFKVCIRKLPPARDFNEQEFHANVARVVSQLGLAPDAVYVEHFVGGKLR